MHREKGKHHHRRRHHHQFIYNFDRFWSRTAMALSVKQTGIGMRSREGKTAFRFCLWHLTRHHSRCTGPMHLLLLTHTYACMHTSHQTHKKNTCQHTLTHSHTKNQTHTNAPSSIHRMCLVMLLSCFHAYSPVISIYTCPSHGIPFRRTHSNTQWDSTTISRVHKCVRLFSSFSPLHFVFLHKNLYLLLTQSKPMDEEKNTPYKEWIGSLYGWRRETRRERERETQIKRIKQKEKNTKISTEHLHLPTSISIDIRSLAHYVLSPSLSLLRILSLVYISLCFAHSFTRIHVCLTMRITLSLQTNNSKKTKREEWERDE